MTYILEVEFENDNGYHCSCCRKISTDDREYETLGEALGDAAKWGKINAGEFEDYWIGGVTLLRGAPMEWDEDEIERKLNEAFKRGEKEGEHEAEMDELRKELSSLRRTVSNIRKQIEEAPDLPKRLKDAEGLVRDVEKKLEAMTNEQPSEA